MSGRPKDLPDFENPPLVEVVLGVQFERIQGFQSIHIGDLWKAFRDKFPFVQEQPPLGPSFETFGTRSQTKGPKVELISGPMPTPRLWFMDEAKNELIQFQSDRFIHNWRKISESDPYPRYEQIKENFADELNVLARFLEQSELGDLRPNQCEVTYINHIVSEEAENLCADPGKVFRMFGNMPDTLRAEEIEDAQFLLRYVIKSDDQLPVGRLLIESKPGFSDEGLPVIALSILVRGQPSEPNIESALEFIDIGREKIVGHFAQSTTELMHGRWRRKQ
ncbi:TIGR04255 family protein [Pelagibius litoralis]|uniref:TIGR04255 family protein n=1 Tax=Pelagibius litoralis TaxID=374515 RepID=A0A967K9H6_9PROT|nr:TIGR04255 family protein [Pelagibius litoralis]NIA71053.1 TIGR04255 family protein [Pelagibius litoralis]